jgi:hypothetical protein
MSATWFDSEGNPIDAAPDAVGWQVRRVVGRGRPRLLYAADGLPLFLPITAGVGELRRAVEVEGQYRLCPVDENRRAIAGARVAHVAFGRLPMPDEAAIAVSTGAVPTPAVAGAPLDELAALSRTSLALAGQLIACVPVLLSTADALLRSSENADASLATAIRDLMK